MNEWHWSTHALKWPSLCCCVSKLFKCAIFIFLFNQQGNVYLNRDKWTLSNKFFHFKVVVIQLVALEDEMLYST